MNKMLAIVILLLLVSSMTGIAVIDINSLIKNIFSDVKHNLTLPLPSVVPTSVKPTPTPSHSSNCDIRWPNCDPDQVPYQG